MESNNPYQAPDADLSQNPEMLGQDTSSVFSIKGRFGRLSYLAWSLVMTVVVWLAMLVMSIIAGVAMGNGGGGEAGPLIVGFLSILVAIGGAWFGIVFGGRRLHDMNLSAWWLLLMLVPIVSFIFILVLWFAPGKDVDNRFAPPRETPGWEKVVGWLFPLAIVAFIGLMSAVAIPAYQQYLEEARRAVGG